MNKLVAFALTVFVVPGSYAATIDIGDAEDDWANTLIKFLQSVVDLINGPILVGVIVIGLVAAVGSVLLGIRGAALVAARAIAAACILVALPAILEFIGVI